MKKVVYKYTQSDGSILEVGVFDGSGIKDKKDVVANGLFVLRDNQISAWDEEDNNVKYEIPEWLADGIRELILNHKEVLEWNNE